jgi:lipoprotein-releasing system ATP-binding protein
MNDPRESMEGAPLLGTTKAAYSNVPKRLVRRSDGSDDQSVSCRTAFRMGKVGGTSQAKLSSDLAALRLGAFQLHLRQEAIRIEGLKKVFRSGAAELVLFENLSFEVGKGEMLAIVGESGAGKSTLLHILGALDKPSAGEVYFAELCLSSLSENQAADFRNREIGFVWQFHYLLPEFTAAENVAMPLLMRGDGRAAAEKEALAWLKQVGLEQRAGHRAGELSGGEQQRAALARALITKPRVLLADEPTGDLDNRTSETVFELISRLHEEHQLSSLIATHNLSFARRCHRVLRLENGSVEEVRPESLAE